MQMVAYFRWSLGHVWLYGLFAVYKTGHFAKDELQFTIIAMCPLKRPISGDKKLNKEYAGMLDACF